MEVSAFLDGRFVALGGLTFGIESHALNYGTSVFEGIRAYWDADTEELYLFRADRHYSRLHRSAGFYDMALPHSEDELCAISVALLARDGVRVDVHLRPIVFKSTKRSACGGPTSRTAWSSSTCRWAGTSPPAASAAA